ncbi:hypothetical protein COS23_01825 [bacterium (Candidatus Moisslbacteria) CG02_land_8_20_14_3_00_36_53]|uniref:HEPN AbiU2-like domain-containing protein n=1 Tax=Candidatus Falkowbacteria bacterium CG1_02_37_44 TaxID=1805146 RepID=A0A1J4TE67_9BACT|nr:MAG: hypothetical protein AUJ27_00650 [Candidatus Falkowbacteria bacterium CG1_02_37_44]PIV45940.1 MAG: hypothetical protein COS23_01825 [bacterium (Candidatus Moisslbacteria) CG02_land_8_20_14_3_00_36_53]
MSQEFKTLFEYLKNLRSRYFHALSAFYIYEGLLELSAPNIIGTKEAEENVKTLSRFKNFFIMSKEALRVYFFLELAKLFDESKQSLHINKIVNFAGSNIKSLSKNDFLEFHQGRTFISELFKQYKAIDKNDLIEIKNKIKKHEKTIKKLDDYRNQYLAHEDKKKKQISINSGEIQNLFKLIADILNLFSSRLDFSTTMYSHVEKECKEDTKRVVDYLKRFEPYRLKEIEKKYNLGK